MAAGASEEAILLRIELARVAAGRVEKNDYARQRLMELQKSLLQFYVGQRQDAKAESILNTLTEDENRDGEILAARVELAARGHRLDALLGGLSSGSAGEIPTLDWQVLRSAAASLSVGGDKADALTIWEFVFEQLQLTHGLMVSDYMGLAEARLRD